MTSEPLHRPFIGITLCVDDYAKVQSLLPTPSYTDTIHSRYNQKTTLIYVLEGYITSHNQYRWISNIRLGLEEYLCVPFWFEEEFTITDTTEVTNAVYEIKELSKAFKAPLIIYPKIMYPSNKQELYKRLCWYGKRLIHQKCFTKEALISAGLLMNRKLGDAYSNKDLHKKVLGAYMWLVENIDGFKVKLDDVELKKAHSKGATTTNAIRTQTTKQLIDEAIAAGNYLKPNGKVNKAALAKALGFSRSTIVRHLHD